MRWIRDLTGRFPQRPFYETEELDTECEGIVDAFLTVRYGAARYPITTNDLTLLVEREADELDLYDDLVDDGDGVEGVTEFRPGRKPRVRILRDLSEEPWRENRLRTTLTHELGHVRFHNVLLVFDRSQQLPLFGAHPAPLEINCHRDSILGAGVTDWMEWQAGYASGALLMPITRVRQIVGLFLDELGRYGAIEDGTPIAEEFIRRVQRHFAVSAPAARVRLLQLGHLVDHQTGTPLLS